MYYFDYTIDLICYFMIIFIKENKNKYNGKVIIRFKITIIILNINDIENCIVMITNNGSSDWRYKKESYLELTEPFIDVGYDRYWSITDMCYSVKWNL